MSRRVIRRRAAAQAISTAVNNTDEDLLREFRQKTAPTSNLQSGVRVDDAASGASQMAARQPDARMLRVPQNVSAELAALKSKLDQCVSKVSNWSQVLTEVTQSVFVLCATCTVANVPYYLDVPENERALSSPVGRLDAGRKVTLLYPQLVRNNMIYMRIRLVDEHSGDVQLYYVPIANQSLTQTQLAQTVGINSTADQYFDWFHNPGDPDPAPVDEAVA